MTTLLSQATEIVYPSSDGEPLAETSVHVDAIIDVVVVLRQYLEGQSAIVLADQFLYYSQGYPKLRLAPDIMVILMFLPVPATTIKSGKKVRCPLLSLKSRLKERGSGIKPSRKSFTNS